MCEDAILEQADIDRDDEDVSMTRDEGACVDARSKTAIIFLRVDAMGGTSFPRFSFSFSCFDRPSLESAWRYAESDADTQARGCYSG